MIEELDRALTDLIYMTIEEITAAKKAQYWSKDFVEGVCIVMSMAYNRFGGAAGGNQQATYPITYAK